MSMIFDQTGTSLQNHCPVTTCGELNDGGTGEEIKWYAISLQFFPLAEIVEHSSSSLLKDLNSS
jgi:hypothetical protein